MVWLDEHDSFSEWIERHDAKLAMAHTLLAVLLFCWTDSWWSKFMLTAGILFCIIGRDLRRGED